MIQILIPYILLIAGLAASFVLFLSLKNEMRRTTAKNRQLLDELKAQIDQASLQPLPPEPVVVPATVRPAMNISKRVQAMRMVRRNEDVSNIAAALGTTRSEVELLIRVQKMSSARSAAGK